MTVVSWTYAPERLVNTTTAGARSLGSICILKDGGFVVAWFDASSHGVRLRVFNADGTFSF